MIPGDLLSACPHRQFHTLPSLLDSWAALPNSNPNACVPMQGVSLHHFMMVFGMTRPRGHDFVYLVKHEFAKKSLKYIIPKLICNTPISIKDKVYTHSLEGFNLYVKRYYLNNYTFTCDNPHTCYTCQTAY